MSFAFMPLYTGDYLRDTRHLSPLRHGVYFLLLTHCWDSKGPAPLDEQECAGIANCRSADEVDALRYILERFFVRMDDGWYSERMQKEIERAAALSTVRTDAGRRGANERMRRFREAKAKQVLSTSQASAKTLGISPSTCLASDATPTPTPTTTPTPTATPTPAVASDVSSQSKQSQKPSAASATAEVKATRKQAWDSYTQAYEARYRVPPVRNAKVNSLVCRLVDRIGEDAAAVAAHYVLSNDQTYSRSGHCLDLLIRDAEKLRTEWATGRTTTATQARLADRTASNPFVRMLGEAK